MKLKTYRARTMAEALAQVKRELGADAVILHTRTAKRGGVLGIGAKSVVEIIASDEQPRQRPGGGASGQAAQRERRASPQRGGRGQAAPAKTGQGNGSELLAALAQAGRDDASQPRRSSASVSAQGRPEAVSLRAAAGKGPQRGMETGMGVGVAVKDDEPLVMQVRAAKNKANGGPQRLTTPIRPVTPAGGGHAGGRLAQYAGSGEGAGTSGGGWGGELHEELASIKRMVGQVLQQAPASASAAGSMPEALFNQYLRLLEQEVARDIADEIVAAVRDELTAAELTDESIVRTTVLRHVSAMIPTAGDVSVPKATGDGRPLTIALVGPTGVGKTTTIAKLAAAYKLRHGKKVGLITSDTYRIAAVEQLRTYANIIGLPVSVVLTPHEMAEAVESLSDCDVVLIDTAGRSQHNERQLGELHDVLAAARPHQTHLVVSSAASDTVIKRIGEQFESVRPTHVILTKLDEAVNFGVVLNAVSNINASLSFVTTGQDVPDHIMVGQPDRLARMVLDGSIGTPSGEVNRRKTEAAVAATGGGV